MKELKKLIENYSTKYPEGFVQSEIEDITSRFPELNMDKFHNALRGITCMIKNKEIVIYHCDILQALICGTENRDLNYFEWD